MLSAAALFSALAVGESVAAPLLLRGEHGRVRAHGLGHEHPDETSFILYAGGEMLALNEIFEKNPNAVKNYGIWLRYRSRTDQHNMYKEYRDVTLTGAASLRLLEHAHANSHSICGALLLRGSDGSISSVSARETVGEKPSFRGSLGRYRAIVPMDGYYEWVRDEKGRRKQPYFIAPADGSSSNASAWANGERRGHRLCNRACAKHS